MKKNLLRRMTIAVAMTAATSMMLTSCATLNPFSSLLQQKQSGVPATAEQYYAQEIDWHSCENGMQCAEVLAPLDWENVNSKNPVTLNLTRQQATGTDRLGSVFVNPGGPGASGTSFVNGNVDSAASTRLQEYYDVIGWDPRGVAGSSAVVCYDAEDMDEFLFGVADETPRSAAWIEEMREDAADFGEACAENTGELLAHIDTISTAHDLDMLRALVNDKQLNYIGYSYGTLIGSYYAELFPKNVGRMVLDGVVDPTATVFDMVLYQTKGFESALASYLAWCLEGTECPFTGTVAEAEASIAALLAKVEATPPRGADGRLLSTSTLLTAIIFPLYDEGYWSYLNTLFAQLKTGDTQMAFALADAYFARDQNGVYTDNSNEAFSAINCLDYERVTDLATMQKNAAAIEAAAPIFGKYQGFGELSCVDWPYPAKTLRTEITAAGAAPILVVGTTGDPATPYQWAVNLAGTLESGALVTYNGEGHTAYNRSNTCVQDAVDNYMIKGTVPSADPQC